MKKILLVLLTFGMLCGCQGKKEDNVIKIGAILPLTGSASYAAEFMKKGLDLAVKELNNVSNFKYEIIYEDSKALPKDGLIAYTKLRSQNINFIVCAISSVGMAIAPKTNNEDVILFGTAIVPPDFVSVSNRALRVYPNAEGMTASIAHHNHQNLMFERPAVIYINNDMGLDCFKVYSNIAAKHGVQVEYSEAYDGNQKDFKDIVNKILKYNIDVVYVSGFGESYVSFVKQFNSDPRTSNIVLTGDMTFSLPDTKSKIGTPKSQIYYADGIISEQFSNIYSSYYGEDVNSYAAYTYTIPFMLESAINTGCSLNDIVGIYKHITDTTFNTSVGLLHFMPNGESNLQFSIKKLF